MTKTALILSIEHWELNYKLAKAGSQYPDRSEDCALCGAYYDDSDMEQEACYRCPLYSAGKGCESDVGPWRIQIRSQGDFGGPNKIGSSENVQAVKNMLDTLKALL